MTVSHAGKVIFITGAASGIGLTTAELFLRKGYAVTLVDINEAAGREAEEKLRAIGPCKFIACDVAEDEAVRDAVAETLDTFGRLDAAFNAAGIAGDLGPKLADASIENWRRVMATDLDGVFFCMRHQIPAMLKSGGGAIVNCASIAGITGAPNFTAYVAAKHGVVGLTKAAALDYARQGIRVNVVCPGMIDAPSNRNAIAPDFAKELIEQSAIGRFGVPSEIATTVLWLCEDATFVIGQAITVDGGFTVA